MTILYPIVGFFGRARTSQAPEDLYFQYLSSLVVAHWYTISSSWASQICFFLGIQNWNPESSAVELGSMGKLYWGHLFWALRQQRMLTYREKPKNEADSCREVEKRSDSPLVLENLPAWEEIQLHFLPLPYELSLLLQLYTKFSFTLS